MYTLYLTKLHEDGNNNFKKIIHFRMQKMYLHDTRCKPTHMFAYQRQHTIFVYY